jgi:hypothetical protein
MLPDIFEDNRWEMSPGERAAVKGVLGELQPAVAIEIGTAQGGSLRRIAAAAGHVHAFDESPPPVDLAELTNVTFHTGDSHELLPEALEQLERSGARVGFVLVDGDHTSAGVQRDVEDLLASPAISESLIMLHDTANPEVRSGLDAIDFSAWGKLTWVDLDWVPGFVFREGPSRGEAWGGLGVIVAGDADAPARNGPAIASYAYPTPDLLSLASAALRR